MKIAVLGDHVHPVIAPFAGGLEAMTWYLSAWLADRGHEVTLFAAPGSRVPGVRTVELDLGFDPSDIARHDSSMPDPALLRAHHAYLDVVRRLASRAGHHDVVHMHCLHPLPVAMAGLWGRPTVLTLHSPPTPWLESALAISRGHAPHLVAVSQANRALWAESFEAVDVIANGVDLDRWPVGDGRSGVAAWCGRINPEKAPHLAVAAARRAGLALRIAGPIEDRDYFSHRLEPLLGADVRYVGCLDHRRLGRLVGESAVLFQTPQWDEPFCLAAAEAIACGTPVAAFARGGLREVIGTDGGALCAPDDVGALARAARQAIGLSRERVRLHAERQLSLERCGLAYEELFARLAAPASGSRGPDLSPPVGR